MKVYQRGLLAILCFSIYLSLTFFTSNYFLIKQELNEVKSEYRDYQKSSILTKENHYMIPHEYHVNEPNKKFEFPIHDDDFLAFTSPYGERDATSIGGSGIRFHEGLDLYGKYIQISWKARILSIDKGIVIEAWPAPNGYFKGHPLFGGYIRIKHDNGVISSYGHLSEVLVKEGQKVDKVELIGRQGNTGYSAGDHLHFELEINGQRVNPYLYLKIPETKGS